MPDVYATADWAAWVAAIRAEPDADLPRLVAADWLDDRGEAERAEFVRVQVEIAAAARRVGACDFIRSARPPIDTCYDRRDGLRHVARTGCGSCRSRLPLHYRQRELWKSLTHTVYAAKSRQLWGCPIDQITVPERPVLHYPHDVYIVRRGFVAEARCSPAAWVAHGDRLLTREPVSRVVLTSQPAVFDADDGTECRFAGDPKPVHFTRAECWAADAGSGDPRPLAGMLRLRWPGVEFELPPLPLEGEFRFVDGELVSVGGQVAGSFRFRGPPIDTSRLRDSL